MSDHRCENGIFSSEIEVLLAQAPTRPSMRQVEAWLAGYDDDAAFWSKFSEQDEARLDA